MKGAKGANIIMAMGVIAIFISAFFILFTFERLVGNNIVCIMHGKGECTPENFTSSTFGLFIIFALLVMIFVAAYVMLTCLNAGTSYKYKGGPDKK